MGLSGWGSEHRCVTTWGTLQLWRPWYPSWAGCGFNLLWSISILAPMSSSLWLLIAAGTCSEYQGRFCWARRGPSSLGYNVWRVGWTHGHNLVGVSVPMCEGITWEQSSDTSTDKKGRVHHKQDITPLQRLTEKAFTARRKLHTFLMQKHFLNVQMPINSPAGEGCWEEHGGAAGRCGCDSAFSSHNLHPSGLQEGLSLAERRGRVPCLWEISRGRNVQRS